MKDKIKKTKIGFGFIKLFLKESFFVSLYVSIMLAMLGTGIFFYLMVKTEPASSLFTRNIAQTSIIYDRTGQHTLYEIHGEENRKILAHEEIPDVMRVTAIATEDNNFYIHQGIDPKAIMRALKTNFENGQILQGGSTITQQLARNAFLTREKTLNRKVLEAVYAIKIERHFSKEQILDAYLNEVPYGSNAYGIEAAAETYFDKKASELTLDEAALLSAMTKAPSYYSPYGNNREALERRQRDVLKKTAELRLADPAMIEEALKINTLEKVIPLNQPIQAPHFVFYV
ncbi:MAG TPA: penicillin-binding protein, partial [Candidatus Moranbacteria bacterium]|nr:penicillin-binding protein [Candidatus Moranbacteria bacterium]